MIKKPIFAIEFEKSDAGKYFLLTLDDGDFGMTKINEDGVAECPIGGDSMYMDSVIDAKEFIPQQFIQQS